MKLRERVAELLRILPSVYPNAHCELTHSNPYELLVATILSAQCTDARVNQVTPALFKKYPTPAALAEAPVEAIEELVHSTGFYKAKAKNLKNCCIHIQAKHGGAVPDNTEALEALPGVGRKTANVVLGTAFGIHQGIVVDTHVSRLSERLGLTREKDPEKIERALMKLIPREHWTPLSHWLIFHGRRRCSARKPDCAKCELAAICPSKQA